MWDEVVAVTLTNLKQRRRALRQKTVYVSPELLRDVTTYAKDAGLSPTSFLFQSQKSDGLPISRQHAWRLIHQYAACADIAVVGQASYATAKRRRHQAAARAPPPIRAIASSPRSGVVLDAALVVLVRAQLLSKSAVRDLMLPSAVCTLTSPLRTLVISSSTTPR